MKFLTWLTLTLFLVAWLAIAWRSIKVTRQIHRERGTSVFSPDGTGIIIVYVAAALVLGLSLSAITGNSGLSFAFMPAAFGIGLIRHHRQIAEDIRDHQNKMWSWKAWQYPRSQLPVIRVMVLLTGLLITVGGSATMLQAVFPDAEISVGYLPLGIAGIGMALYSGWLARYVTGAADKSGRRFSPSTQKATRMTIILVGLFLTVSAVLSLLQ